MSKKHNQVPNTITQGYTDSTQHRLEFIRGGENSLDEERSQIFGISQISQPEELATHVSYEKQIPSNLYSECIIRSADPWRIRWDLLIILLALYNSISIPFTVAFQTEEEYLLFDIWEYTVDTLFVIDILVNFRCTYIDREGEEIYDPKLIAKNYVVGGRFAIDLIATIPFEQLPLIFEMNDDSKSLKLFQIFKMVRLLRLRRIITYLKFKTDFKLSLRIILIIFNLFLFVHLTACFWNMLVETNDKWMPSKDFGSGQTDYYDTDSRSYKYSVALYYATLMLLGADVLPYDQAQTTFACIILLLGSIVTAALFGHMTVLVQNLNKKTAQFHDQVDTANQAMTNLDLPSTAQESVLDYITHTYSNQDHQKELEKFFDMISPSLKYEVRVHLYRDLLWKNYIFGKYQELVEFIIHRLQTELVSPENVLINRGDSGDEMYFIARGEVKIKTLDHELQEYCPHILKQGQFFGEIALLTPSRRTATAISFNFCTLALLKRPDFEEMIERFPNAHDGLIAHMLTYQDDYQFHIQSLLIQIPFLSKLKENEIALISLHTRMVNYEEQSSIINRGDASEDIYIVLSGEVHFIMHCIEPFPVKIFHPGSIIGFMGAITQVPYQCSLICSTPATILTLNKSVIDEFCGKSIILDSAITAVKKRFETDFIPRAPDYIEFKTMNSLSGLFRDCVLRVMKAEQIRRFKQSASKIYNLIKVIKEYQELCRNEDNEGQESEYRDMLMEIMRSTNDLLAKVENVARARASVI